MSQSEQETNDGEENEQEEEISTIESDQLNQYLARVEARYSDQTYFRTKKALLEFESLLQSEDREPDELDITEIDQDDANDYLDYLSLSEKSGLTIRGLFSGFKCCLEYHDNDACEDVELDHLSNKTLKSQHLGTDVPYITAEEHKQMLAACETKREELILRLLWETGVRRSELVDLKINDIKDYAQNPHPDTPDRSILVDNKKNDDNRYVYYTIHTAPVLREWLKNGYRDRYDTASKSPYLLVSNQKPQVQEKYPNEVVKRVAERAGIQSVICQDAQGRDLHRVTAHAYRHSFAIHRVRNGCPINFLQRLLGHRQLESTEFYLNFVNDDVKEANEKYRPKL